MERHLGRVDLVVGSVVAVRVHAYYRESAEDTGLHRILDTFVYSRDVFLRNRTADNRRLEGVCLLTVCIHRLEFNFAVSVLSASTGLFCILAVDVRCLGNGLFVSNLLCAYVGLYLELAEKTVNDDLKVKLTHTCDDRLSCFRICMSAECRVFFCKFCKRLTELALGCFGLRLDRDLDNRIREFHGLKDYRVLLVTDRITCCGDLESDRCSDISGVNLIQLCTVVCMHLKDTS